MNTENVKQHILNTAKPIILGKGFTAVGLSEILSAADVPKGSFYHYFKSKEGFGEALLDDYFSNYFEQLGTLLRQADKSAAESLMQYWGLWLECQANDETERKCLVVKLAAEVSDLSESMRITLQRGTAEIINHLANCIQAGIADGSLKSHIVPKTTAQSLYALWLGATLLAKVSRERKPLEDAMQTSLALLALPSSFVINN